MRNRRTVRIAIRYALAVLLFGLSIYVLAWGAKHSCSSHAKSSLLATLATIVLWTIAIINVLRAGNPEYWACPICKTRNEETRTECLHCGQPNTK